jgi:hypothetical protein
MKYVWAALDGKTNSRQLLLENINALRTRHIRGYGFGVTFSSQISGWKQTLSKPISELRFHKTSFSRYSSAE